MAISRAFYNYVIIGLFPILERDCIPIYVGQNRFLDTNRRPIGVSQSRVTPMGNISLDGAEFPALQCDILGRVTATNTQDAFASIQLAINEIMSMNEGAFERRVSVIIRTTSSDHLTQLTE